MTFIATTNPGPLKKYLAKQSFSLWASRPWSCLVIFSWSIWKTWMLLKDNDRLSPCWIFDTTLEFLAQIQNENIFKLPVLKYTVAKILRLLCKNKFWAVSYVKESSEIKFIEQLWHDEHCFVRLQIWFNKLNLRFLLCCIFSFMFVKQIEHW